MNEMYKLKEITQMYKISYNTLRNAILTGKLHAYRIGRYYMVQKADIESYLGLTDNSEIQNLKQQIKELELKLKGYEIQYNSIRNVINSVNDIVNVR